MDNIARCAQKYAELLEKDYFLTLENGIVLHIFFKKHNFKHLLGLHKLIDLQESKLSSGVLFKKALNGNLTDSILKKSSFYDLIADRIAAFPDVEKVFGKKIIVDFNPLLLESCKLEAEYLLYTQYGEGFIILSIGNTVSEEYPESFFYERTNQYLSGQLFLDVVKLEIKTHQKKTNKRGRT